jgi:hypothetical protein
VPRMATVPREVWPSWERYTTEEEQTLSMESLILLDRRWPEVGGAEVEEWYFLNSRRERP